jgi:hypothetical protein
MTWDATNTNRANAWKTRIADGHIAQTAGIAPELLSVDKLFPTLIDHYIKATYIAFGAEGMFEKMLATSPHLRHPSIVKVDHQAHLLEKRSENRSQRRFCKGRARATSYNKIPGAKKLLRN